MTKTFKNNLVIKRLVFSAASIALATVTANYLSFHLPFGGSITVFSMLLASLPGFLFGPVTGFCAALAHGLLQLISNPQIVHPVQLILDYILAFTALGITGLFSKRKNGLIVGYSFAVLGRFVFSAISGIVFYTEFIGNAGADLLAILSGIGYNLSYMLPEYVFTLVLLMIPAVRRAIQYIKNLGVN